MKGKKITIKIKDKKPRGTMPPPTKAFRNKKKTENKYKCRNPITEQE